MIPMSLRPIAAPRIERAPSQPPVRFARLSRLAHRFRSARSRKQDPEIDPTLPATSAIVDVQQPIADVPERPYDLLLLGAALGLLAIGTVAIFSSTAADGMAHHKNPTHYL
ncbi:MAG: hypothetical protein H0V17_12250, partial [Deltaproteobacteria bacterium]|nr:hypothetical protein [Deltaproteobacteria bacterium]